MAIRKANSLTDCVWIHDIRVSLPGEKGVEISMDGRPCSRAISRKISKGDRACVSSDLYLSLIEFCKMENSDDDERGGAEGGSVR